MNQRFWPIRPFALLVALILLAGACENAATASDIDEFSLPQFSQPGRIVGGPDGNLWFTEEGPNSGGGIGRITPSGSIANFPVASGRLVSSGIVAGPDHNLWFTEIGLGSSGFIARMAIDGTITEFQLPSINGNDDVDPIDIVNGPDGALWFTASEQVYDTNSYQYDCRQTVGRITPEGKITLVPYSGPMLWTGWVCPSALAKGADGNLWFTSFQDSVVNDIIRITKDGTTTPFPLPNYATAADIVSGPDGNLWFTQNIPAIGRISPSGSVTNFLLPSDAGRLPELITPGPDGNLWFAETGGYTPAIGKITPAGTITEFPLPGDYPSVLKVGGITTGPDGKLWFTDTVNDKIGTFATTLSVPIEASFSGAWFDPAQSGHGLFIEVLPDSRFLAWWFTFAPDGGQAWFGGVGTYSGNTATITQVALTTGGRFIPNFDPTAITQTLWGTLTFTFDDCNHGRVDFDSVVGYGNGSMSLSRLTQVDGTTCPRSGAPPAPPSTPSTITDYPVSNLPTNIVSGPDGNLWFTEAGQSAGIGTITPAGVSKHFSLPASNTAANSNIVVGPDGNLWFVEGGLAYDCPNSTFCPTPPCTYQPTELRVASITPSGTVQDFVFPSDGRSAHGIASGADHNLWFTKGESIVRITPAGTATEFPLPNAGDPYGIASGSDGNLWFTEYTGNKIGRITPAGVIEEFALPADVGAPTAIINGPDGNLWFIGGTQVDALGFLSGSRIGRITPSGTLTEFVPPGGVTALSTGPDGNIWFTEYARNRIGKIAPTGEITELVSLAPYSGPAGITTGPDGKLWFTEAGKIGTFDKTLATPINNSFTGAWFDPAQSGHGLFVEVLPESRFLAWWFTFAPDGGQAWFGGVGTYFGNTATIAQVALTTGGRFIPNFDPTAITQTLWGTLTFTFDDCNHGRVDFDSVLGYGAGSMPLTRLTQIDTTSCPQ